MRTSQNKFKNARLIDGYDYKNQAWVIAGRYIDCGHPVNMNCGCFGREHENELTKQERTGGDYGHKI